MTKFDPRKSYNNLPMLPPKIDLETKQVLKKCISANKILAELKGTGCLIPNQAILIQTLPLQEARMSSEIENIITTADKLYQAAALPETQIDPQTKEVLRYRTALKRGCDLLRTKPLGINLFIEVCSVLKGREMPIRKVSGTALKTHAAGEIIYTPPEGYDRLMTLLSNLETYIHNVSNNIDPLVKMAMMHYQFEAIHPFTDGNGRTGRILNLLYLIENGLLEIPVMYLSRYFIENRKEYYRLLKEVTENQDWHNWILYMLSAVEQTAVQTREKILAVRQLMEKTTQICRDKMPSRIYSKELIEQIFVQPYCRIANLVDAKIARRATASKRLQSLVEIGILHPLKVGRELLFIHPALLKILT